MKERYTPSDFYFSPDSQIWKVHREKILVMCGGQRALLMQIAHPLMSQAISDHSYFKQNPIGRLKNTRDLLSTLIFGTREEVYDAARKINNAHKPVKGTLENTIGPYSGGTPYSAKNPDLIMWVWSTFTETSLVVYNKFVRLLSDEEKEELYQEAKRILPLLGVKAEDAPTTTEEFSGYIKEMIQTGKVTVSEQAKDLARYIMLQKSIFTKLLSFPLSRMVTGLLPEELRSQYGFTWSQSDQRLLDTTASVYRRINPYIIDQLRFSPRYLKSRKTI